MIEVEFAHDNGIEMALGSFCYPPFVFGGPYDFMQFVSHFPSTKLGVLLDVGHLYKAKSVLPKQFGHSEVVSQTSTSTTPHCKKISGKQPIFPSEEETSISAD